MAQELRRIYRWENPARTGRLVAVYFSLWYISHIMTFFYGYLIYSVIKNHYYPQSVEELQESIKRALDRGSTALKVGELIDKHGSDNWLDPLLDELGPYIQLQIADLASLLEACYNFYHFSSTSATVHSLCLFGTFFLTSAFGDARFLSKLFWLIGGIVFFVCWPIGSLHPQYRLLVSPLKWALWDVPNHAEWSFEFLQYRSAVVTQEILESQSSRIADKSPSVCSTAADDSDSSSFYSVETEALEEKEIISFLCTFHNVPDHLIISTDGLRLFSRASKFLFLSSFYRPYSDLIEMSKLQANPSALRSIAKLTTGSHKLELRFKGGEERATVGCFGEEERADVILLENMRERDKAFNAVIGFSQVRWQHLQKQPLQNETHKPKVYG